RSGAPHGAGRQRSCRRAWHRLEDGHREAACMKVLVLSTMVPFVHGGAEELFIHLVRNLQSAGVEAEGFRIPFTWNPAERLIDEMLIARQLRLFNFDLVIALKFPAYLVPWNDKVLWLLHQYRQAYDLLDAGQSNIAPDARG